jgi:hypothetical protein
MLPHRTIVLAYVNTSTIHNIISYQVIPACTISPAIQMKCPASSIPWWVFLRIKGTSENNAVSARLFLIN